MSRIKQGSKVQWTSQAQGTWKQKIGTVVEVVPPNQEPQSDLKTPGAPRDHESYVISVPGKTARAKPKLYWPVARFVTRSP